MSIRGFKDLIDQLISLGDEPEGEIPTLHFQMRGELTVLKDSWTASLFGIERKDRKFFSVRLVQRKYPAPIIVEESPVYSREACENIVGRIILPTRGETASLEFALSVLNGYGSYCQTTFSAPRCSLSNPAQVDTDTTNPPVRGYVFTSVGVHTNVNRVAGRVKCMILPERMVQGLDQDKIVWFPLRYAEPLLDHERMTDPPTRELLTRLLLVHWQDACRKRRSSVER